ncbi:MAG: hypothetical protein MI743_22205 [Sneathiellales bacterium]|nr:hypothetical protein [Sneathiellales bacterium]
MSDKPNGENQDQPARDETIIDVEAEEVEAEKTEKEPSFSDPIPESLTGKTDTVPAAKGKSRLGLYAGSLLVVFALGLAAWPVLYPAVSSYLPESTKEIIAGRLGQAEQNTEISKKIAELQEKMSAAPASASSVDLTPLQTGLEATRSQLDDLAAAVETLKNGPVQDTGSAELEKILAEEQNKVANMEVALAALSEEIKILKNQPAPASAAPTEAPALSEELQGKLSGFDEKLAGFASDIADLRATLTSANEKIGAQGTEVAALSTALKNQVDQQLASGDLAREAALLLSLGQLQRESRKSEPFETALKQAAAVAPGDVKERLEILEPAAKTGAPTALALKEEFAALAQDITQASRLPDTETWYGKTLHNLASLVKFRRVDDTEGGSVDALVAGAELALEKNDLKGAIEAVAGLQDAPADVAASWLEKAKARHLVDSELSALLSMLSAETVKSGEK